MIGLVKKLFRITSTGQVPAYEQLPYEIRSRFNKEDIRFIEEQYRIVIRTDRKYSTWQYNPISGKYMLMQETG